MTIVRGITRGIVSDITSGIIFTNGVIIKAFGGGQSLIDRMDEVAYVAALPSGSEYGEAAVGGSPLTRTAGDFGAEAYWVDNEAMPMVNGSLLDNYFTAVDAQFSSRTDVNCVIWQDWNAERFRVTTDGTGSGNMTTSEYSAALDYLITTFKAQHGSDVKIVIGLPHRRTSTTTQEEYGAQQIRQVYIDLVEGDANIFGTENCDIDLEDATHFKITSGETEFGTRMGEMSNYALNGGVKPDYPVLQSATIDYDEVTCVFDTDITAPSSGVGHLAGEAGGLKVTGSSLIRTGANTAKFTLSDNVTMAVDNTPFMRVSTGVNEGLASTGADTLNNSAGTLPARGKHLAVTSTNVITNVTGVDNVWLPKYGKKTYSSGALVSNAEAMKGTDWEEHPNGFNTEATYDGTLFGGVGGVKDALGSVCMQNVTGFTAGAEKTIFVVLDMPVTPTGLRVLQFGIKDGSTDSDASLFFSSSRFKWSKDQGSGFPFLNPSSVSGAVVIGMRFNALGSFDFFFNSVSVTTNIDPRDDYSFYDTLHLFARAGQTDGVQGMGLGALVTASATALSDTNVGIVMNELGTKFGVTIT